MSSSIYFYYWIIFHFIYPFTSWWMGLGCFHFVALLNSTVMNKKFLCTFLMYFFNVLLCTSFYVDTDFISPEYVSRSSTALLRHVATPFTLLRNYSFPNQLHHFTFPPAMCEGGIFFLMPKNSVCLRSEWLLELRILTMRSSA